ncbi:MAG: hypothetical protein WDW36_008155 [Sanguina aurantia]
MMNRLQVVKLELSPSDRSLGHPAVTYAQLPKQHFTGNPLDRALDLKRRFDGTSNEVEVSLVVVAGREVCVRNAGPAAVGSPAPPTGHGPPVGGVDSPASLPAQQQEQTRRLGSSGSGVTLPGAQLDLQALLLGFQDPELDLTSEFICLHWGQEDSVHQIPLYLLGKDHSQRWTFALDVSEVKAPFLEFLRDACGLEVSMQDLRHAMPALSADACAIAGQAVSLSQWHQTHKFCPRCGSATLPVETGLRRACLSDSAHKQYPRTDPVVIMLVESPDGQRALLGRSQKFTAGMYTCLSGFIDQCESIEEAVRREVCEEARLVVDEVRVIGSQPWPIGRAGSCELMLGCMAKARSYEIFVNQAEMEDVQWYDKEELRAAVRLYEECQAESSVAELQRSAMESLGFFIPPPLAIAHHLIRAWAMHDGPWFPSQTPATTTASAAAAALNAPSPEQQQQQQQEQMGDLRMPASASAAATTTSPPRYTPSSVESLDNDGNDGNAGIPALPTAGSFTSLDLADDVSRANLGGSSYASFTALSGASPRRPVGGKL